MGLFIKKIIIIIFFELFLDPKFLNRLFAVSVAIQNKAQYLLRFVENLGAG